MYNGLQKILNYIYEPYTATVVVILASGINLIIS